MTVALLPVISAASILLLAYTVSRYLWRKRSKLPPGPRPLPIIGNLLDIPRTHLGREYADLSAKYGDVVYMEVLGQQLILLGSYEAAQELLNKRATLYSDRPRSVMCELCGISPAITLFKQYGSSLRFDRSAFQQAYNPDAIVSHHHIHLANTRRFLRDMLIAPKRISQQSRFVFAATTVQVVYGLELTGLDDERYGMIQKFTEFITEISVPGQFLVDVVPALRFLPSWLPGAGFKQFSEKMGRECLFVINLFFNAAVNLDRDSHSESMVADMLHRLDGGPTNDSIGTDEPEVRMKMIKDIAVTALAAAVDTTHLVSQAFLMAMAMYPDVQKKAQAEIDGVVGPDRLPEFYDRDALPYTNAIIKEVLRWHVAAPIGVPHSTSTEDVYNGYYIPKGAVVIPIVWAMARDPAIYPDPDNFVPERFLDESGKLNLEIGDPADLAFGFGRRKCPGQYFADAALFIFCASVLHMFHVQPPLGEDGVPIKIAHEMTTNRLDSHTKAYEYILKPRSPTCAEHLLSGMAADPHGV